MKIDRISFEELFPTGTYANQRLKAEIVLDGGEDPIKAFLLAKELVYKAFEQTKPQLEYASIPGHPMYVQPEPKSEEQISREQQIEGYYEIIKIAKTADQLTKHWGNIERLKDLELVNAYNKKLNQLS